MDVEDLSAIRQDIDKIDQGAGAASLSADGLFPPGGETKRRQGLPILNQEREDAILWASVAAMARLGHGGGRI